MIFVISRTDEVFSFENKPPPQRRLRSKHVRWDFVHFLLFEHADIGTRAKETEDGEGRVESVLSIPPFPFLFFFFFISLRKTHKIPRERLLRRLFSMKHILPITMSRAPPPPPHPILFFFFIKYGELCCV